MRAALVGGGKVTFDCDGTIFLANPLNIETNTTLDGGSHNIVLSGGGTNRVFLVNPGVTFRLTRMAVTDGYYNLLGNPGGGMLNHGSVIINQCVFSNNFTAGDSAFGGAINHMGESLVVNETTFVRNSSDILGGAIVCGHPGLGGYISGNISITNCTFFGNGAEAVSIGEPLTKPVTIVNSTFAWNTNRAVRHWSSGFFPGAAGVTLINCILADTVGGVAIQGVIDGGHNLSTDGSLTNVTSMTNTDPLLSNLMANGGRTWTMALQSGSPAINAGVPAVQLLTDQRGLNRLQGNCDIGAYEYAPAAAVSGRITGYRIPLGVTVSSGGNSSLTFTDGRFLLVGLESGAQTITPTKPGSVFLPNSRTISGDGVVDVDFVAYEVGYLTPEPEIGHFTFAGNPSDEYEVLVTTNLNNWSSYSTAVVSSNGVFSVVDPAPSGSRFFRTRKL